MRVKKVQTRDGIKYFYGDQQISMDVFDALSNMSSSDYYDSDDELSFNGGAAKNNMRVKKVQTRDGFKYFYGDQQISMDVFDALSNMSSSDYYDSDDELSFYGGAAKAFNKKVGKLLTFKWKQLKKQKKQKKKDAIKALFTSDKIKPLQLLPEQYTLLRDLLIPSQKKKYLFGILEDIPSEVRSKIWTTIIPSEIPFWNNLVKDKVVLEQQAGRIITINGDDLIPPEYLPKSIWKSELSVGILLKYIENSKYTKDIFQYLDDDDRKRILPQIKQKNKQKLIELIKDNISKYPKDIFQYLDDDDRLQLLKDIKDNEERMKLIKDNLPNHVDSKLIIQIVNEYPAYYLDGFKYYNNNNTDCDLDLKVAEVLLNNPEHKDLYVKIFEKLKTRHAKKTHKLLLERIELWLDPESFKIWLDYNEQTKEDEAYKNIRLELVEYLIERGKDMDAILTPKIKSVLNELQNQQHYNIDHATSLKYHVETLLDPNVDIYKLVVEDWPYDPFSKYWLYARWSKDPRWIKLLHDALIHEKTKVKDKDRATYVGHINDYWEFTKDIYGVKSLVSEIVEQEQEQEQEQEPVLKPEPDQKRKHDPFFDALNGLTPIDEQVTGGLFYLIQKLTTKYDLSYAQFRQFKLDFGRMNLKQVNKLFMNYFTYRLQKGPLPEDERTLIEIGEIDDALRIELKKSTITYLENLVKSLSILKYFEQAIDGSKKDKELQQYRRLFEAVMDHKDSDGISGFAYLLKHHYVSSSDGPEGEDVKLPSEPVESREYYIQKITQFLQEFGKQTQNQKLKESFTNPDKFFKFNNWIIMHFSSEHLRFIYSLEIKEYENGNELIKIWKDQFLEDSVKDVKLIDAYNEFKIEKQKQQSDPIIPTLDDFEHYFTLNHNVDNKTIIGLDWKYPDKTLTFKTAFSTAFGPKSIKELPKCFIVILIEYFKYADPDTFNNATDLVIEYLKIAEEYYDQESPRNFLRNTLTKISKYLDNTSLYGLSTQLSEMVMAGLKRWAASSLKEYLDDNKDIHDGIFYRSIGDERVKLREMLHTNFPDIMENDGVKIWVSSVLNKFQTNKELNPHHHLEYVVNDVFPYVADEEPEDKKSNKQKTFDDLVREWFYDTKGNEEGEAFTNLLEIKRGLYKQVWKTYFEGKGKDLGLNVNDPLEHEKSDTVKAYKRIIHLKKINVCLHHLDSKIKDLLDPKLFYPFHQEPYRLFNEEQKEEYEGIDIAVNSVWEAYTDKETLKDLLRKVQEDAHKRLVNVLDKVPVKKPIEDPSEDPITNYYKGEYDLAPEQQEEFKVWKHILERYNPDTAKFKIDLPGLEKEMEFLGFFRTTKSKWVLNTIIDSIGLYFEVIKKITNEDKLLGLIVVPISDADLKNLYKTYIRVIRDLIKVPEETHLTELEEKGVKKNLPRLFNAIAIAIAP